MDDIRYNTDPIRSYDNSNITSEIDHVLEAFLNIMPGSHNLIVYSDMGILKMIYPIYIKSLLENNEIVLILTHYYSTSKMRQMLLNADNKENNTLDLEGYMHDDRSLLNHKL